MLNLKENQENQDLSKKESRDRIPEGIATVTREVENVSDDLQILTEQINDVCVVKFIGELNIFNLEFANEVMSKVINNKRYNVIMNLAELNYVDSSGIGFITGSLKKLYEKGGDMKIVYMTPYVERIFNVLHLDYFLDIYDEMDDALKDFKANIAKAIFKWQKIVDMKPNYADAYYHLAIAYKNSGMFKEAKDEVKKSLSINGNYAEALNFYGELLLSEKKIDKAEGIFKQVLEISPQNMNGLLNLALCFNDKNKLSEAITRFKAAIALYPNYPDLFYHLGNALIKHGEYLEAIKYLKQAISLNPNYLEAHRSLASSYIKINDNKEAINELNSITRISLDEKEIEECRKSINTLRLTDDKNIVKENIGIKIKK